MSDALHTLLRLALAMTGGVVVFTGAFALAVAVGARRKRLNTARRGNVQPSE